MDCPIYISFVVSIYNVSDYLDECIQSLCRIKNPRIEILLINDGSTDSCPEICQKYAKEDGRICVITQENQGLPMSRNKGLKLAKGKWICFVDGDDCLSDDFDGRIIQHIDEDVEINYFGYQRMENDVTPRCIEQSNYYLTEDDLSEVRMRILNSEIYQDTHKFPGTVSFGSSFTKFINREKLLEWKVTFDPLVSWGEDLLFNFKLLPHVKKARVIDHTGYFYRINAASMTQKYDVQATEKFHLLVDAIGTEVRKTGSEEVLRQYKVFVLKQLLQSIQRDMLNPQNKKPYCVRKEDYRRIRFSQVVQSALKEFPYREVRALYRVAIRTTATGSYGILLLFYQIKRLKKGNK